MVLESASPAKSMKSAEVAVRQVGSPSHDPGTGMRTGMKKGSQIQH